MIGNTKTSEVISINEPVRTPVKETRCCFDGWKLLQPVKCLYMGFIKRGNACCVAIDRYYERWDKREALEKRRKLDANYCYEASEQIRREEILTKMRIEREQKEQLFDIRSEVEMDDFEVVIDESVESDTDETNETREELNDDIQKLKETTKEQSKIITEYKKLLTGAQDSSKYWREKYEEMKK